VGDPELDAAILQLEKPLPDDLRPIALTGDTERLEPFVSAGHPRQEGPDISHIHGAIVAPQTSIFGGVPAIQLHSEEAGDEMPIGGMSGAPVLVDSGARRAAVGLIRWNPTRPDNPALSIGGTVYACPIQAIVDRWPNIKGYPKICSFRNFCHLLCLRKSSPQENEKYHGWIHAPTKANFEEPSG